MGEKCWRGLKIFKQHQKALAMTTNHIYRTAGSSVPYKAPHCPLALSLCDCSLSVFFTRQSASKTGLPFGATNHASELETPLSLCHFIDYAQFNIHSGRHLLHPPSIEEKTRFALEYWKHTCEGEVVNDCHKTQADNCHPFLPFPNEAMAVAGTWTLERAQAFPLSACWARTSHLWRWLWFLHPVPVLKDPESVLVVTQLGSSWLDGWKSWKSLLFQGGWRQDRPITFNKQLPFLYLSLFQTLISIFQELRFIY